MGEQDIFVTAMDIQDPADRSRYLDEACKEDPALRERVDQLIEQSVRLGSFLEHPPVEVVALELDVLDEAKSFEATIMQGDGSTCGDEIEAEQPVDQTVLEEHKEISLGFLQSSSDPDSLGRLGHYEILEIVGRGAFGTVLRALDVKLQRIVAIKVLSPELASTSPARKRFLREARSSAQVRHENVVAIYAVEDQPIPYLVMEFIPGKTLQQRLEDQGPLELVDVLRIGKQIADGLTAAHAQGLIHRDIKPGNILLEGDMEQRVKITDFGLARAADDASMTQSGMIAGTPLYMAPEQALGRKLDQRADLFSLGSVLYQMISGRPPFRARTTVAVLKRVADDKPRPIPEIIPEVPEWMCHIVARLHEKNPDDRFETAKEVGDLLQNCLTDLQEGRIPDVAAPPSVVKLAEAEQAEPSHRRDGRQTMRPAMKLAVGLLILFAGFGFTEGNGVTKISQTVIRLVYGTGTLIIETDDPHLTVSIDGEEVTITGAGIKQLTLTPGEHQVATFNNGEPVKQELVTITRNGEVRLRMSLESNVAVQKPDIREDIESAHISRPADAPLPAIAPFEAEQAKAHQDAWAKHLGVPVEKEILLGQDKDGKDITLTLVLIPPGEFLMGSTKEEQSLFINRKQSIPELVSGEGPQRRVRMTKPVWMSRNEVTIGQFRTFVNATNYRTEAERDGQGGVSLKGDVWEWEQATQHVWNEDLGHSQSDNHPVSQITWNDTMKFCDWLSEKNGYAMDLPSEAQWEYACRAGTETFWQFGNEEETAVQNAWVDPISKGESHPVGQEMPNQWGLYDMHGNVWEWCRDWFDANYYAYAPDNDPSGPAIGSVRVLRGGSWATTTYRSRSAVRHPYRPEARFSYLGFRVVASLPEETLRSKLSTEELMTESHEPFADADIARIAALTVEQQIEEVRQELIRRNPGFDGKLTPTIEDDKVTGLEFRTYHVTDISPVRALVHLEKLVAKGYTEKGLLSDLSPLQGMQLTYLDVNYNDKIHNLEPLRGMPLKAMWCYGCPISDLSPLHGMPLEHLFLWGWTGTDLTPLTGMPLKKINIGGNSRVQDLNALADLPLEHLTINLTQVSDLTPLQGLPLESLSAEGTQVSDLSPLRGKKLTRLTCAKSNVSDLSVLRGMPLKEIRCDFQPARDTEILRSLESLETINDKPAAEFWKDDGNTTFQWPADAPPPAIAPFDADQAKQHQQAWADYLGVPVEKDVVVGQDADGKDVTLTMVLVPPNEFMMGTGKEEASAIAGQVPDWARDTVLSESPPKRVVISKPFYIGKTEVTVGQFRQFVDESDYQTLDESNGLGGLRWVTGEENVRSKEHTWRHQDLCTSEENPVAQVCVIDAQKFCQWLSLRDTLEFDLPTETQWESACRSGTLTPWSFGNDVAKCDQYTWSNGPLDFTGKPVATKLPNSFGLFDMHGNVSELCRMSEGKYRTRGGHGGLSVLLAGSATLNWSEKVEDTPSYAQTGFRVIAAIPEIVLRGKNLRTGPQSTESK